MGLQADLADYQARLYSAIEQTMETNVLDTARSEIVSVLNDYQWTMSRGGARGSGGLRDVGEIHGEVRRVANQITIEITDDADFQEHALRAGDTLDEVVTRGDPKYYMPEPRPFMQPAEEAMGSGLFEKTLMQGLRERGF